MKQGQATAEYLRAVVSRIEKLESERADIAACIRDVYAEAAGNGYCRNALREVIRLRKMDAQEREERETVLDVYLRALGMGAEGETA